MKNLLVWYLPQAALAMLGAYWGAKDGAKMVAICAVALPGIYTAAVLIVRDAPTHFRGIGLPARRVFVGLLALFVLALIWVAAAAQDAVVIAAAAALFGLLWALSFGLWHSFTVRPGGPSQQAEPISPELGSTQALQPPSVETSQFRLDR